MMQKKVCPVLYVNQQEIQKTNKSRHDLFQLENIKELFLHLKNDQRIITSIEKDKHK